MELKTGIITNLEQKASVKGAPYWVVYIDKLKYNIFDLKILNDCKLMDVVDYVTEVNEKGFNTLVSLKKSQIKQEKEGSDITLSSVPSPAIKQEFHLSVEQVRSNALDLSIKAIKIGVDYEEKDLFTIAKKFEKYILTGE